MIDWDKWQEIFNSLRKQKLRTSLTAFGVFWGIFMLVILLGIGTGFSNSVETQYRGIKSFVWIWSSSPTQLAYKGLNKGRRIILTPEDMLAIHDKLPGIKKIEGVNQIRNQAAIHEKNSGSFSLYGTHAGLQPVMGLEVIQGRYINENDEQELRKVAVIGTRVRDVLFKKEENIIGKTIEIQGIFFQVVGIYKSTEPDNPYQSSSIYIPGNTLGHAFNRLDRYTYLVFEPKEGYAVDTALRDVRNILYERKKVHPEDTGVIGSYDNGEEYRQNKAIVIGILGFSWLVAIGTIIAGVIGVGNIMLVIIKERTREIGLRKALGATPSKISAMIMQEAMVITTASGYLGLVSGVLTLELIKIVLAKTGQTDGRFSNPFIDIYTALTALSVLIIAGVLAALLPAIKAASINPITALQDE